MRSLTRGLLVFLPIILVGALIQALLVVGDPVPTLSWWFSAKAVASAFVLIIMVWLTVGFAARTNGRFSLRLLLAVTVAVICGILAAVLNPILALVVALVSLPVLSAAAAGPLRSVTRTITSAPLRTIFGIAWAAALIIVNAAAALVLGFFVTGPVAAGITWLVFGISATALAIYWASLHRRASCS